MELTRLVLAILVVVVGGEAARMTYVHNGPGSFCFYDQGYHLCDTGTTHRREGDPCEAGFMSDGDEGCTGCYVDVVVTRGPTGEVVNMPSDSLYQVFRYKKCVNHYKSRGTCSGRRRGWFRGRKKCWDRKERTRVEIYLGPGTLKSATDVRDARKRGQIHTREVSFKKNCECY